MRSRRSAGRMLLAGVMVVGLAACGRAEESPGGTGASGAASQAPEVDTGAASGEISVWAMGTEGENLEVLAGAFMTEDRKSVV